jgi:hypothetical protein
MASNILAKLPIFNEGDIMRYLLGCALLVLSAPYAFSQTPALSFTGSSPSNAATTSTRGYVFDVLSPTGINVSGLSFFDAGADGLSESHDVGLWDSSGNLLASATVPSGTLASLDTNGLFRVVNISSVFLAQGTSYRVGAVFVAGSGDTQAANLIGVSTPTELQYIGGAFINNGVASLTFPNSNIALGLPGGSFEFAAVAVPEPATVAMLILLTGTGTAVWYRRRNRLLQQSEGKLKLRGRR